MFKPNNKYNLIITSIILIGFILSNWAEFYHHHGLQNLKSCCGSSCSIELNIKTSLDESNAVNIGSECSLCKVISVSSFNFLINQFIIDFLSKTFDFAYYQSINYTFLKILNLKNKSPPQKN